MFNIIAIANKDEHIPNKCSYQHIIYYIVHKRNNQHENLRKTYTEEKTKRWRSL